MTPKVCRTRETGSDEHCALKDGIQCPDLRVHTFFLLPCLFGFPFPFLIHFTQGAAILAARPSHTLWWGHWSWLEPAVSSMEQPQPRLAKVPCSPSTDKIFTPAPNTVTRTLFSFALIACLYSKLSYNCTISKLMTFLTLNIHLKMTIVLEDLKLTSGIFRGVILFSCITLHFTVEST